MRLFAIFTFFLSRNSLSIPSAMYLWKYGKNARLYSPETFEISSFVIIPKKYLEILNMSKSFKIKLMCVRLSNPSYPSTSLV